jgi:hypothetical protein
MRVIIGEVVLGRIIPFIKREVKDRLERTEIITEVVRECEKRGYDGIAVNALM